MTDDPNSIADALDARADWHRANAHNMDDVYDARLHRDHQNEVADLLITAARLLREQADTADRLAALTDAIEAHRAANTSNCNNLSCEKGCGHDLRLYAALDAEQPSDPKGTK